MSSSLFNSLMGAKSSAGAFGGNLLTHAVGAWMRGESPQDFVRSIAKTHPAFRQIDANNLEAEAHRICQERGIDEGELAEQIKQYLSKM